MEYYVGTMRIDNKRGAMVYKKYYNGRWNIVFGLPWGTKIISLPYLPKDI